MRVSDWLGLIHTDACGTTETPSTGGGWYFITFIDDDSSWAIVFLMTHKSDDRTYCLEFERMAERQTARFIRALREVRGGEYLCNTLEEVSVAVDLIDSSPPRIPHMKLME